MKAQSPFGTERRARGFTLIEVMIVSVIVGLLATIALPAYQNSVRKSRRSEAVTALALLQQAQERWRANNASYAANSALSAAAPNGLGFSSTTTNGRYAISITANSASGYTLAASAVPGLGQTDDAAGATSCAVLTVTSAAGTITNSPAPCWSR